MRQSRLYIECPLHAGSTLTLDKSQSHYLGRVLRARTGAAIELFNGDGYNYAGIIESISRHEITVSISSRSAAGSASPCRIRLLQSLSRNEKMDWVIQKAVELGVAEIQPIETSRSLIQLDEKRASRREAHWRSVIIGAAQQCGRSEIPPVKAPLDLASALATVADDERCMIALPDAEQSLYQVLHTEQRQAKVAVMIGPEGGFDPEERSVIASANFLAVRAGPRVLRTETAAIALISAIQLVWGDLN